MTSKYQRLRDEHNIINEWDLGKRYAAAMHEEVPPIVVYRPTQQGRAYQSAAWQILRPGFKTDARGHWTNNWMKTFDVYALEEREAQRLAAIAWATEQYHITEWAKSPITLSRGPRSWIPLKVAQWADQLLKARKEDNG